MSVLPISHECNDVLSMPGGLLDLDGSRRGTFFSGASSAKKAGRVDWRAMKEHVRSIENFYAPDVVFESGMARCRWEVESGPHPEEEEEEEQHQAVVQSVAHSEVHSEVVSVHSVAHTEVTSPAIGRWADEADEHWQPSRTHDAHSETTSHWSASPVQSNVDSDMVFASPASPNGYDYYDDRHYGYGYAPVAYTATPSWTPNPMSSSSSRTTRSHSPDHDDETSYIRYEITRSQSAGSHAFPRRTLKDELDSVPSNSSGSETSSDEDELPSPPITPPAHQTLNRMTRMNLARLDTSVGMFNRRQLPSANPRTAVSGTQTLVSATQRNRELLSASREVLISSAVATVARGNYLDSAVRGSYMDYEEEMMLMRTAMDGYPSAVDGIPLWAITSPLETESDKKEKDRQQQSPISRDLAPRSAQDSDIRMSTVSPQQQQKPETTDVMDYSYTYSEWSTYSDAQAFDVEKEDKEKSDPNRMSIVFDSMPMSAVQPEPEPYPFIDQQLQVAFPLPQDTAQSATYQPSSLGVGLSVAPVPIPVPAPAQDPNMVYTGLGDAYGYGGAFNFLNFTPPETTIAPATDNAHSNFMPTPNIVENHNDSLGGSFAMIDSPYSIPPSAPSFSFSTYQTEVVSAVSPGVGCGGFLFPHTPGVNSPAPVSPAPLPIRPPPSPATRAARTKSRTFRFPGSHHPHVPPSSAMLPNTNTSRSRMRVNGTTSRSRSRKARSSSRAPGTRARTTSMSFLSSVLAFPRRSGSGSNSNDVPPVPSIPRRSEEREKTSTLITAPKPPPPTPASCTPSGSGSGSTGSSSSSISTTNADQMHGSLKAGTWTQSCSFGSGFRKEEAKTTGVVLGPTSPGASIGRRRRRRGPLDWLSPGKLFATIMPSSSS
ncbi:hypothetical protein C8Q75DRAFT_602226 [Abortiporus biennis]|nr:hypothetical protein C8Q75DRAFT_602226 [Abortiporus biennis]